MAVALTMGISSCDSFLDRPTEDNYNIDNFYQTDDQLYQAVNPIYNSPWYDFERGFVKIGDVLSGNIYYGTDNKYQTFNLVSTDEDVVSASASIWSVNAYCNGVIENIDSKAGSGTTEKARNTVKGEALTWKAMAYFYLVRCFGAVPIINSNSQIIADGTSATLHRNKIEDVYKYIILTLEKAVNLLPETNTAGRIDKYSAYGLLAKVYLTKSGYGHSDTGKRDEGDLAKAAEYAKIVIEKSGRILEPNYADIFQLKDNKCSESLIAWQPTVGAQWTCQNSLQSDLSMKNFSDAVQSWGEYVGPTIDLEEAFGESAANKERNNTDARRKATMMMYGDHYDYFWTDKGGFDYNWDNSSTGKYQGTIPFVSPTGANLVKHIVGRTADAQAQGYSSLDRMATPLATHLLRLADVYLVYAEAVLGNNASTSDASALAAFNAVRGRSVKNYTPKLSLTFDDIFKERRLELACEGDYWYDFVRLHYYKPDLAKEILKKQERGSWNGLDNWYTEGTKDDNFGINSFPADALTDEDFEIPFPETDKTMNPILISGEPESFDFSSIGY